MTYHTDYGTYQSYWQDNGFGTLIRVGNKGMKARSYFFEGEYCVD
jgi:hypothetical protein